MTVVRRLAYPERSLKLL